MGRNEGWARRGSRRARAARAHGGCRQSCSAARGQRDARLKQAEAELTDARQDLTRLQKGAKTIQSAIDQLAATAAAQCAPGEPTAADTTDDLELRALAPKAAQACAAIDFTGTWTGTYHEAADTCVPSRKSGPMTMTLTQTGSSLSGTLVDQGYNLGCSNVDLHGTVTGTVTGSTAGIQTVYDNDAGTYRATLTLKGDTLTFEEESGDTATLTHG